MPDIDKIIVLSDFFNVSTDYLLKGTELMATQNDKSHMGMVTGTALNIIGVITAVLLWGEYQNNRALLRGLILVTAGCTVFAVCVNHAERRNQVIYNFLKINIWFIMFIPVYRLLGKVFCFFPFSMTLRFFGSIAVLGAIGTLMLKIAKIRLNI